jgi:hypothetical protein
MVLCANTMLFFQSNKMDVWQKIIARTAKISSAQIQEERREREEAKRKKEGNRDIRGFFTVKI